MVPECRIVASKWMECKTEACFSEKGLAWQDKGLTEALGQLGLEPNGIAIHKDGRLFVACTGSGKMISLEPDGSRLRFKFRGLAQGSRLFSHGQ